MVEGLALRHGLVALRHLPMAFFSTAAETRTRTRTRTKSARRGSRGAGKARGVGRGRSRPAPAPPERAGRVLPRPLPRPFTSVRKPRRRPSAHRRGVNAVSPRRV